MTNDPAPKRKRGRPRTGELTEMAAGYGARITIDLDGETVRKRVRLSTGDPTVARKKLKRIVREEAPLPMPLTPAGVETFAQAAERIMPARRVVRPEWEFNRLRKCVFGIHDEGSDALLKRKATQLWHGPVAAVTPADLSWALEFTRDRGLSKSSVKHLRDGLKYLFETLASPLEGCISKSPMLAVPLPKFAKRVEKPTEILEDDELVVYLAWEHPVERFREGVIQRQMMSAVSRMFGGIRTWDLNVIVWEGFEIGDDGTFIRGWAPRTKKGVPQRLMVPEELRPLLHWYWVRCGRPRQGLMFPALRAAAAGVVRRKDGTTYVRRAGGVGESRKQPSHAKAFRRDLMRALGIEVYALDAETNTFQWRVARPMTERERALFLEGPYTEPVDFHSWRRAYCQALEEAAPDKAMLGYRAKLADHDDTATHELYLRRFGKGLEVPAGSMPRLAEGMPSTGIFGQALAKNQEGGFRAMSTSDVITTTSKRARKDSNLRPMAPEAGSLVANSANPLETEGVAGVRDDAKVPSETHGGRNSRPEKDEPNLTLSEGMLADLMALASQAKRWDLTQALSSQLETLSAARADQKVTSLADARRRRGEGGK